MPSYTNSRHFGQMVARRRRELGLGLGLGLGLKAWELQEHGGPVQATVEKTERGEGILKHTTLVRFDQSLNWPAGSAERARPGDAIARRAR